MNVKNCRRCKRLFNYIAGQQICPACKEELEQIFQKVKEFVREHADASVRNVAKEFQISEEQVHQWIKEERLIFSEPSIAGIRCEICGEPIATGKYCEKCRANTINSLNSLLPKEPQKTVKKEKERARMRFLDK